MFKHILAGCFSLLTASAFSQTLFNYGTDSVSVPVFLQAYHKNNTGAKNAKAMRAYLDLYIASRLKVKEAKARRYDTLPQIAGDLAGLRSQIMPSYLNDAQSLDRLVQEAFQRGQKDIRVAHIFIPAKDTDTAAARKKAMEAEGKLKEGTDFKGVAQQYSADPSVQQNGGDLGYITVFTLPYELENIIYTTKPGQTSPLYRSAAGYHIFRNLGERKALGRIKAAQILLAFAPDADAVGRARIASLADSLYNRLQQGDDFGRLAMEFSNDAFSAGAQGQMQEFGVGEYDAVFESQVYNLKDGAISRPFATNFGYHIVKKISGVPVPAKATEEALLAMRAKVQESDRMQSITDALVHKILAEHYRPASFSQQELSWYTDSLLDGKKGKPGITLKPGSRLFTMGDQIITAADWISFAQTNRLNNDGSGVKTHAALWDEFVTTTAMDYYRDHLESFNPAFRQQMDEFREGNLFFEIMQQEVWSKAQTDTAALRNYYEQNRKRYVWTASADAVVFYVTDLPTANQFRQQLLQKPANWKNLVNNMNEKVAADSNRYETSQIPGVKKYTKTGTITEPVVNPSDKTVSFAYILKQYPQTEQRSFADARGLVVNDYQAELEKAWLAELKKKYPVVINQKELAKLMGK